MGGGRIAAREMHRNATGPTRTFASAQGGYKPFEFSSTGLPLREHRRGGGRKFLGMEALSQLPEQRETEVGNPGFTRCCGGCRDKVEQSHSGVADGRGLRDMLRGDIRGGNSRATPCLFAAAADGDRLTREAKVALQLQCTPALQKTPKLLPNAIPALRS